MTTTRIKVEVTKQDIDANSHHCARCPVALAASRAFGEPMEAARHYLYRARTWWESVAQLPPVASDWIRDYDNLRPVRPFTFDLDVPAEVLGAAAPAGA